MSGILGNSQSQGRGILGGFRGYSPIRQIAQPMGQPGAPSPMMAMGGGGGGQGGGVEDGDAMALQQFGPGGLLWREIIRAMGGKGNPLAFLDPKKAGKFFSPTTRGILGDRYQTGEKAK